MFRFKEESRDVGVSKIVDNVSQAARKFVGLSNFVQRSARGSTTAAAARLLSKVHGGGGGGDPQQHKVQENLGRNNQVYVSLSPVRIFKKTTQNPSKVKFLKLKMLRFNRQEEGLEPPTDREPCLQPAATQIPAQLIF